MEVFREMQQGPHDWLHQQPGLTWHELVISRCRISQQPLFSWRVSSGGVRTPSTVWMASTRRIVLQQKPSRCFGLNRYGTRFVSFVASRQSSSNEAFPGLAHDEVQCGCSRPRNRSRARTSPRHEPSRRIARTSWTTSIGQPLSITSGR